MISRYLCRVQCTYAITNACQPKVPFRLILILNPFTYEYKSCWPRLLNMQNMYRKQWPRKIKTESLCCFFQLEHFTTNCVNLWSYTKWESLCVAFCEFEVLFITTYMWNTGFSVIWCVVCVGGFPPFRLDCQFIFNLHQNWPQTSVGYVIT